MIRNVSFMGTNLELDDALLYYAPLDYWIRMDREKEEVVFGLTPAAPIKEGGYRAVEFTVQEGEEVKAGDTVAVAVTAKIKYLEAVTGGIVVALNRKLEQNIAGCFTSLDHNWLARIRTDRGGKMLSALIDFSRYLEILRMHEGHCAPPGVKAAGSPTCRSVYESIRKQKES
ncbi:MAG: hypothetical protein AB1796_10230 [Bacillota bacterium]